ncbi:MAG: TonB-dependent receptor [Rudaea sp.]|nr:TonB-dependent receptor [Rudaea sp.]
MRKPLPFRKKLLASLIATAVASTVAMPRITWAQTADAALRGKAAADSQITAKNVATGVVRRTKAAADGSYALVGLPPGTYQVDAGPGTEKTVTLSVASTSTLDLTASTTTTLEGISVSATALADVKTSEVGATVSLHQIQNVPQLTRNFLEFADTVPGMVFNVNQNGNTSLTSGGLSVDAVNVYIDGVGQKNYVETGGATGQTASQGNPFPQLAIGEYKVITSNYKAEYDQVSSAAVTAETKSGTNEFHGEVFGTYTDSNYRDEIPTEVAAGTKETSQEKEYGFAIGGPIIQDTLHFFLTYEAKRFDTPIGVVPGGTVGAGALLPESAQAQLGPASLPFNEDLYFAKVDWEFSDRDRIEVSAKIRDETSITGTGNTTASSAAINNRNNDKRYDFRWQHSADHWFNELKFTYENAVYNPTSVGFGNGSLYTQPLNNNALVLDVGPASPLATQNKGQKGPGFSDDLTFNDLNWYGDHVVKMGVKFKEVTLTAQDAGEFNPQYYYDVTPTGTLSTPYQVLFPVVAPGRSPIATTKDKQFGTYIQDDWAVNDKLTLNLGVRWDYEETPSYLNFVTPASVVAAFNSQAPGAPAGTTYAQTLAAGGININDYISTGNNRSAPKNEIQPRLGFSYDMNADEQHVIHGGLGRSYDRDLYTTLQLEETKSVLSEPTITFPNQFHNCAAGPTCIAFDPSYYNLATLQGLVAGTTAGQEVDLINNDLKAPYSDQFSLGMSNKVGDWNTNATFARILSYDGLVFQLGNRYPNGAFWESCGNGCISQPWGNGVPGFGSLILGSNGLETRTSQVLLSADKPYTKESGWGATIAYTYTDSKQNNDNNDLTDQYAFDEATIKDYPFIPSVIAKHRLVSTFTTDGPWDVVYAFKLTLASPIPDDNLACPGGDGAPNVPFPTGSLCTPHSGVPQGQRFAFGGRIFGDRQIDMQATKNFELTPGMTLYARMDFLNIFNFKNYVGYLENWGSNGVLNKYPVAYSTTGNIEGVPRTVKLTVGFRF